MYETIAIPAINRAATITLLLICLLKAIIPMRNKTTNDVNMFPKKSVYAFSIPILISIVGIITNRANANIRRPERLTKRP